MCTFVTHSVLLHLILVLAKRQKIRKRSKIWVFLPVGTCRYFQILTGTFPKNSDTFGYLRLSETVGKWIYLVNRGGEGGTDRERELPNYSID